MAPIRQRAFGPIGVGVANGVGAAVLLLGVMGAIYGLIYGPGANDKDPPGLGSAKFGAASWVIFMGPVAALVGGFDVAVGGRREGPGEPASGIAGRFRGAANVVTIGGRVAAFHSWGVRS